MSDSKNPTDDEIGQLVDVLVTILPSLVSDLFGKRVSAIQLTKEKKEELIVELRDLITRLQRVEELKQQFKEPATTSEEFRSRLDKIANELAPVAEVPEGVHFADYLRQRCRLFALAPMSVSFFKETNYIKCFNEIDKICTKAFETSRAIYIDELFEQVFGSEDLLPLLQSYLSGFKETCELLAKKSDRPLEREDTVELIEIYGKISGDFEKAIRIIVGMLKVVEGEHPDYSKVSSQPLGPNVQFVKKRHPILVQDFHTVIRNSISHRSYFIRVSNGTVKFQDRNDRIIVTFKDLFLQCKLLIASTTALTLAPVIFMYRRWDNIWQYLNSKQ